MRESPVFNTSVGSKEKDTILSEPRVQAVINKANRKEATEEEMMKGTWSYLKKRKHP